MDITRRGFLQFLGIVAATIGLRTNFPAPKPQTSLHASDVKTYVSGAALQEGDLVYYCPDDGVVRKVDSVAERHLSIGRISFVSTAPKPSVIEVVLEDYDSSIYSI